MPLEKINIELRKIFGVSKSEATFALLLLCGLVIGFAYKQYKPTNEIYNEVSSASRLYNILDSLAEVQATTYIGTDYSGNVIEELQAKDTIIEKTTFFPRTNSKASTKAAFSGIININTASRVQLMRLPGIGEKTADKIIEYRTNSPFNSPAEIMNVSGIGPKKYENIKSLITVDN